MANFVEQFSEDESGAVTVEFIVLAAGIVGLAIAAFSVVETESQTLANNTGATIQAWDTTGAAGAAGVAGQ